MKTFNDSELRYRFDYLLASIHEVHEDTNEVIEVKLESYDNGTDENGDDLVGFAIDIIGYDISFLYSYDDEALEDFNLLKEKLKDDVADYNFVNNLV